MVHAAVFFGEMMCIEYPRFSVSAKRPSVQEPMASRSSGNPLEASTRDLLGEVRRGSADAREVLYQRYSERLARDRPLPSARRRPRPEFGSPRRESPERHALDAYYRAERLKAEDRWEDSMALLEKAIDLDPGFALQPRR